MADRQDVYQTVTDAIVAQLEAGVRPWSRTWSSAGAAGGGVDLPRRVTGEAYRGVNVLILWGAAAAKGYSQARWMTFKQALALGAAVRKGEKGTQVVFANKLVKERENGEGETEEYAISYLKTYTVFNVEQIDGLGAEWFAPPVAPVIGPEGIAEADEFFARVGVRVRNGGDRAFYSPAADYVQMPPIGAFDDAPAYYATLAHECVHWTGHSSRMAREFGRRFGDNRYTAEELVAEIGAAYVCALLGLSAEPRADHASYLASWLRVLKADKRAIFTAASAASAACDYLAERAGERQALAA